MADIKEERKAQAQKHNALMKGAFASDTKACVEATVIYEDGEGRELEIPEAAFEATETEVTTQFSVNALYRESGKVTVAFPVTFTKPGGNYEDGAFGPEQMLCSESNLYQVLCGLRTQYHTKNRGFSRGMLFTDRALFMPQISFSRDGNIRKADLIGIPEPNRTRALENNRSEREADQCLAQRIEAILRIAVANGTETLIVGAFGCGRQGYPASQVIDLFKAWIDAHPGSLKKVVFSVPRACFDEFDAIFGTPKAPEPVKAAPVEEEEDEEFSIEGIELPEGVTFRS